jgi:hypothetical protein
VRIDLTCEPPMTQPSFIERSDERLFHKRMMNFVSAIVADTGNLRYQ